MATNAYYKCSIEGDYFAKEAGGKTIRRYELDFNVPDLGPDKSDTHYMSIIKHNLLNKQLKAKYPAAITYRTHEMVDRVLCGAAPQTPTPQKQGKSINSMNKNELLNYITVNNLNIDIEIYNTVDKLRKAISSIIENEASFLKEQADIKADIELKKTLNDLNPAPPVDPNAPPLPPADPFAGLGADNNGDDNSNDE